VALAPIVIEEVVEPIKEPLAIVAGKVIALFKVSNLPFNPIVPLLCTI
jgi:hypothetical protein